MLCSFSKNLRLSSPFSMTRRVQLENVPFSRLTSSLFSIEDATPLACTAALTDLFEPETPRKGEGLSWRLRHSPTAVFSALLTEQWEEFVALVAAYEPVIMNDVSLRDYVSRRLQFYYSSFDDSWNWLRLGQAMKQLNPSS